MPQLSGTDAVWGMRWRVSKLRGPCHSRRAGSVADILGTNTIYDLLPFIKEIAWPTHFLMWFS